jgi:hypothetical protein
MPRKTCDLPTGFLLTCACAVKLIKKIMSDRRILFGIFALVWKFEEILALKAIGESYRV